MAPQMIVNSLLILTGAIVMLVCIVNSAGLHPKLGIIPGEAQGRIRFYLTVHTGLMVFFLFGYVASIAAIFLQYPLLSETFVSCIFFFGALFVYIGIVAQRHLVEELARCLSSEK